MTEHYYSKQPQTKHSLKQISQTLRNHPFTFTTDASVFSKHRVDFGSRLLIETFSLKSIDGDILDLGCGYGPIGLSLAKDFPESQVVLVDINERAVALSRENARQNEITNAEVIQSDGFSNVKGRKFATIVTNPPIRAGKKLIYQLFARSKEHLLPNGTLWLVIQKKQGAPSAIKYLESIYKKVEIKARKKGYHIICAYK